MKNSPILRGFEEDVSGAAFVLVPVPDHGVSRDLGTLPLHSHLQLLDPQVHVIILSTPAPELV